MFKFVRLDSAAIISKSSSFNLSLLSKFNLSMIGNSVTVILYLLFTNITLTSEKRFDSFKIFIISLLYSSFKFSGILPNNEIITLESVKLLPFISNKFSFEKRFDEKINIDVKIINKLVDF